MNYKKILSAFLAAVMTVQLSAPVYAEAPVTVCDDDFEAIYCIELSDEEAAEVIRKVDEAYSEASVVYNDKYSAYDHTTDYYYNQLDTEEKALYDDIVDSCEKFASSTVNLTPEESGDGYLDYVYYDGTSITKDEMFKVFYAVYYSNPQFYFLANGYAGAGSGTENAIVVPVVNGAGSNFCLYSTRSRYSGQIERITNAWMTKINSLGSDLEKETYIAERICEHITYTFTDFDQSLAGALVDAECVCNGYAMAMAYFCNAAEIECITVVSEKHAWNRVKLGDNWFEVDTTWMDQESYILYDWFNKSEATFTSEEAQGMHDIDTTYYSGQFTLPECTKDSVPSTEFDEKAARGFVERLYAILLDRNPDSTGLYNHVNRMKNGYTAAEICAKFVTSTELANKKLSNSEFVRRMYLAFFDRAPSAAEISRWATTLENGCTYAYVLKGFVASKEFNKLCDNYGIIAGTYTPTQNRDQNEKLTAYVSRMYTKALKRNYDVTGLNNHTGRYLRGEKTAAEIAKSFFFSAELKNKNLSDEEFVTRLYNALFDRSPDATGKANWLKRIKNGYTREQVFNGFANSTEFKNLVKTFGL